MPGALCGCGRVVGPHRFAAGLSVARTQQSKVAPSATPWPLHPPAPGVALRTGRNQGDHAVRQRNLSLSQPVLPSHNVSLLLTQSTEPIRLVANISKQNLVARWPYHENKSPLL